MPLWTTLQRRTRKLGGKTEATYQFMQPTFAMNFLAFIDAMTLLA